MKEKVAYIVGPDMVYKISKGLDLREKWERASHNVRSQLCENGIDRARLETEIEKDKYYLLRSSNTIFDIYKLVDEYSSEKDINISFSLRRQ